MKKPERIGLMFILLTLTFASIGNIKAQGSASAENMKPFLNSQIPGISIQVNATAEAEPNQNITVMLSLKRQTSIVVEYFNLSIFGFLNGTHEILMCNLTDGGFSLGDSAKLYNRTFTVPEQVWDTTYGEITLTYNATYNVPLSNIQVIIPYENITLGFTMTPVQNVYLASIEDQLANLTTLYLQLQQNYTSLQQNLGELENTRNAVAILAITSIFFLATTLYLVMRKPKNYW
jgi:hypothetical protein